MIGICSKFWNKNYGSMLQNYALLTFFLKHNLDFKLLEFHNKKNIPFILRSLPRLLNPVLIHGKFESYTKKIAKLFDSEFKQGDENRSKAFNNFYETYFSKYAVTYIGLNSIKKEIYNYSTFVSGSDQLWSPDSAGTNFYNLMFVPDTLKKVSIASSFGVKKIPWYQRNKTKKYLQRFDSISVREISGGEIVLKLTGKKVPVVLDPIFLNTRDEWESFLNSERIIKEPYIFAYFLGKNKNIRKKIQSFANKKNIKIVTLKHLDQYIRSDNNFGDFTLYNIGPREFLNLLYFSEYVFTDSFHGTCFSILFNKKFLVFDRYLKENSYSKNSRIDTLCHEFGIYDRRNQSDIYTIDNELDFEAINKTISSKKLELEEYILKSLEDVK